MSQGSLLDLADQLFELEDTINNLGEKADLPEELKEAFESLLEDRDRASNLYYQKINKILNLIRNRKDWIALRKKRIEELQCLINRDKKLIEYLESYLKKHLENSESSKIETVDYKVSVVKNGGKLPLKIDDAILLEHISPDYIITEKVQKLDKEKIREDLENGKVLSFAKLGDRQTRLSIK